MNNTKDPRAILAAYSDGPSAQKYASAEYARFYESAPQESSDLLKLWLARGQNFVVGYADTLAGARITRSHQPDEYVVLIPDSSTQLEIIWNGSVYLIPGGSIAFIPAGASELNVTQPGRLVVMFSSRNNDLCQRCINADAYADPHPNIPPFEAWPEPNDGPKVRHYDLNVLDEPGRFGRIWRCSTFMVNVLPVQMGPRDPTKLSPHHHDAFEQGSFVLDGAFTHHIRWPWNSNLHTWRDDEHEYCASPSLAVIPPPAIHTSRGMGANINLMIDIFSPPRLDFSERPGWVLNGDDYPMPSC